MAEQQFTDEYEATGADAAEQALAVDDQDDDLDEEAAALAADEPEALELPWEADPADAVEQAVSVPVDDDEYR